MAAGTLAIGRARAREVLEVTREHEHVVGRAAARRAARRALAAALADAGRGGALPGPISGPPTVGDSGGVVSGDAVSGGVEICTDSGGAPMVRIAAALLPPGWVATAHVSISHDGGLAAALAVVELARVADTQAH